MHRRSKVARVFAAFVIIGGLAACGNSAATNSSTPTNTEASTFDALAEPEEVPAIARKKLGEAPWVKSINLFHSGFVMVVRDPRNPDNLDRYTYDGGRWTSTPVSVSLDDIAKFDQTTFQFSQVNWKAVPGLIVKALSGLNLEGETISSVSYDRLQGQQPRVYIGVSGLRGSGRLIANADGTNVDVKRS